MRTIFNFSLYNCRIFFEKPDDKTASFEYNGKDKISKRNTGGTIYAEKNRYP